VSLSDDGSVWIIKGQDNRGVGLLDNSGNENDYSTLFDSFSSAPFNDITGYDQNQSFLGTQGDYILRFNQGVLQRLGPSANVYSPNINSVSAITGPVNHLTNGNLYNSSFPNYFPFQKLIYATGDNFYSYTDNSLQNFYPLIDTNYFHPSYKTRFKIQQGDIRQWYIEEHSPTTRIGICQNDRYVGEVHNFLNGGYNSDLGAGIESVDYSRDYLDSTFYNGNYYSAFATTLIYNFSHYNYPIYFWGTDSGLFSADFVCLGSPITTYLKGMKVNRIVPISPFASIMGLDTYNNPFIQNYILAGTDKGLYYTDVYSHIKNDVYQVFKSIPELDGLIIYDIKVDYNCDKSFWVGTNQGLYEIYLKWNPKTPFPQGQIPVQAKGYSTILDTISICSNHPISLYGNFYPYLHYNFNNIGLQWYRNGRIIFGGTTDTLKTALPGKYYLTTSSLCDGIVIDTSNTVVLLNATTPQVHLNYPSSIKVCYDSLITLQATGEKDFHYQWYKNQIPLKGDTLSSISIRDSSGIYSVSALNCLDTLVMSNSVNVQFLKVPRAFIGGDNTVFCQGDTAHLSIQIPSGFLIKWFRQGIELKDFQNRAQISTVDSGNYTVQTSDSSFNCIQTSSNFTLLFNPIPKISIKALNNDTTNCIGETITLKAIPVNPSQIINYKWSTGETSQSIIVNQSGKYSVTASLNTSCSYQKDTTLQFKEPIPFSLGKDTSICFNDLKSGSIVLKGPPGYHHYIWNNQLTNQPNFSVTGPGTYTLTAEGVNGCPFTAQITLSNFCDLKALVFPTLFTPDGNGLNDVFAVQNIESYPDNEMHIYNRYGNEVYSTQGYGVNQKYWTGQGMPEGTYYYVLQVNHQSNGDKKYKGFITLMRSVQ